jgi:hypothetical protein
MWIAFCFPSGCLLLCPGSTLTSTILLWAGSRACLTQLATSGCVQAAHVQIHRDPGVVQRSCSLLLLSCFSAACSWPFQQDRQGLELMPSLLSGMILQWLPVPSVAPDQWQNMPGPVPQFWTPNLVQIAFPAFTAPEWMPESRP